MSAFHPNRTLATNVRFRPIADISRAWNVAQMTSSFRVGALDIAELVHQRIGSYVDMEFLQFLAVEGGHIHCWYMNSGGEGSSFHIQLIRSGEGWDVDLTEHPPGTEQGIEVP